MPATAACYLGQRGRVKQSSRKWRTKRFRNIKWRVSVVSYEVVHALNPRAGVWESPSNTSVWSANEGLRRADGTRGGFPFERWRRRRRAGKTFHHSGISVRSLGKTCRLRSDQKNQYLESAALMGPHIQSCRFDGRVAWVWMKADRWTSCLTMRI